MLKRDSITAQMQQLNQVLARVKRLIIEDNEAEAKLMIEDKLSDYFKLRIDQLMSIDEDGFADEIKNLQFQPEELDTLAYFIDEYAGLQDEFDGQLKMYKYYIALIDLLEEKYQYVSFEHISRRTLLKSQLKDL